MAPLPAMPVPTAGPANNAPPEGAGPNSTANPQADRAPAEPVPATALLRIVLLDGSVPANGSVALVHGPRLAELQNRLAPQSSDGRREPGVLSLQVAGSAEASVPAGAWIWLRVADRFGRTTFESVSPFHGSREVTIDLRRPPTIRVRVLDASFVRPRPHAQVQVLHAELLSSAQVAPETVRTLTCDAAGEALVTHLPRGRILLLVGDATPQDPPPFSAVLIWNDAPQASDALVVLVEREPRRSVVVTTTVDQGALPSPSPKLFLRRIDVPEEGLIPQQGVLRTGTQDVSFQAPAGTYQLDVLPAGSCRINGERRIDVSAAGATGTVLVVPVMASTHMTLRGPGSQDHPLRVAIQPTDGMRTDDPERLFLGPLNWGVGGADVPSIAEPVWVMALGRFQSFLSSQPVVIGGATVEADLAPATCLRVEWAGDLPLTAASPVLVARHGAFECARVFQRDMVLVAAGQRPALVANLVLPAGQVTLRVHVGAHDIWEKTMTLAGRFASTRVGE